MSLFCFKGMLWFLNFRKNCIPQMLTRYFSFPCVEVFFTELIFYFISCQFSVLLSPYVCTLSWKETLDLLCCFPLCWFEVEFIVFLLQPYLSRYRGSTLFPYLCRISNFLIRSDLTFSMSLFLTYSEWMLLVSVNSNSCSAILVGVWVIDCTANSSNSFRSFLSDFSNS